MKTMRSGIKIAEGAAKKSDGKTARTWRTRKWQITRQKIIDATIECIVSRGYYGTTLAEIAKSAGATRGSVQYYFPTAPDAFKAAIKYLHAEWLSRYATAIAALNKSENVLEDGVQLLWRLLQDPLNVAWQELRAASRADATLNGIIEATFAEIEQIRMASDRESYRQLSGIDPVRFELASDFTNVFMEGLTLYPFVERSAERKAALMRLLIQFLGGFWLEAGADPRVIGGVDKHPSSKAPSVAVDARKALELIHTLEPLIRRLSEQES